MNPSQSGAVQEAIARRNMGGATPQLNQVSPQAPMQSDVPQPVTMSSLNKASAPQASGQVQQPKFEPRTQEDLIVTALIEQLKNKHSLEKEKMKMNTPQVMGA